MPNIDSDDDNVPDAPTLMLRLPPDPPLGLANLPPGNLPTANLTPPGSPRLPPNYDHSPYTPEEFVGFEYDRHGNLLYVYNKDIP